MLKKKKEVRLSCPLIMVFTWERREIVSSLFCTEQIIKEPDDLDILLTGRKYAFTYPLIGEN